MEEVNSCLFFSLQALSEECERRSVLSPSHQEPQHSVCCLLSLSRGDCPYSSLSLYPLSRYPDATEEELRAANTVCIICREDMLQRCKRLPCKHIFHTSCLRSWFQRQQNCPTCRYCRPRRVHGFIPSHFSLFLQKVAYSAVPNGAFLHPLSLSLSFHCVLLCFEGTRERV